MINYVIGQCIPRKSNQIILSVIILMHSTLEVSLIIRLELSSLLYAAEDVYLVPFRHIHVESQQNNIRGTF